MELYQLLAYEGELNGKARAMILEAIKLFGTKTDHFDGLSKSYQKEAEDSDDFPEDVKEIVTTVDEKLDYLSESFTDALDTILTKEETNSSNTAVATLTVGKKEITLSATSLLALESKLKELVEVYKHIPTLDPVKHWDEVEDAEKRGVYKTSTLKTYRTEKQPKVITKAEATDKHPAQTELIFVDRQVGFWNTIHTSGRWTPRRKAEALNRLENLIVAVKKARAEANRVVVKETKIAKDIFNYINGE